MEEVESVIDKSQNDAFEIVEDSSRDIERKMLTREEACMGLHTLGKCISGSRYAYLGLDATNGDYRNVGIISSFKHVVYVDVSGNRLTSEALQPLNKMKFLIMIRADRCDITSIKIVPMQYLQILTLNKNSITNVADIEYESLESLELSHNKIDTVKLSNRTLPKLKRLELRNNCLNDISGINCLNLTHLYLAQNYINNIHGLDSLENLYVLHLRDNCLSSLDGFSENCKRLTYLNLRSNKIDNIFEFYKLSFLPNLKVLVTLDNPFVINIDDSEEGDYQIFRYKIITLLPNLIRLDKTLITENEKNTALEL